MSGGVRELSRALIEATALVIPGGAAAQALEASKGYMDPVFHEHGGQVIVTERAA